MKYLTRALEKSRRPSPGDPAKPAELPTGSPEKIGGVSSEDPAKPAELPTGPAPDPDPFDPDRHLAPDYECVVGPIDPRADPLRGVTPAELARAVAELGALNRASGGTRR